MLFYCGSINPFRPHTNSIHSVFTLVNCYPLLHLNLHYSHVRLVTNYADHCCTQLNTIMGTSCSTTTTHEQWLFCCCRTTESRLNICQHKNTTAQQNTTKTDVSCRDYRFQMLSFHRSTKSKTVYAFNTFFLNTSPASQHSP